MSESDVKRVLALRHWTGSVMRRVYGCKCDECTSIKQVCALAREAIAMKAARSRQEIKAFYRTDPV